jgi:hypothetical protein
VDCIIVTSGALLNGPTAGTADLTGFSRNVNCARFNSVQLVMNSSCLAHFSSRFADRNAPTHCRLVVSAVMFSTRRRRILAKDRLCSLPSPAMEQFRTCVWPRVLDTKCWTGRLQPRSRRPIPSPHCLPTSKASVWSCNSHFSITSSPGTNNHTLFTSHSNLMSNHTLWPTQSIEHGMIDHSFDSIVIS